MKKSILVTGGLGFIGSNFIIHLLSKHDYKITNLDAMTYAANPLNLKDFESNPNYKFVKGSICDEILVEKLAKGSDIIVNFAAESHVDRSIDSSLVFTKTNIEGTHKLLENARKCGIERFVQIGTDEVYGSLKPTDKSSTENDMIKPNSPYSASKAAADMLCRAYFETYNLPVIITRSSNNFGPRQFPEKLIPLFITNLLEGKKVPLMGDGSNIRDWIYVEDNCNGIDTVMHNGKIGEVYNIGGGNERTNKEITNKILNYLGKDESWIETIPHRMGHDFRYSLDSSNIKQLGWQPETAFDEQLVKTIEWYILNPDWWKPIKNGAYKK